MSTTTSTSHADTVDDGNSPEAHEESDTQANNGASEADKAVVITNNDAAKAAESTKDATVDTTTTTDKNASTENKAADTQAKASVDTSKLEKKAVDSATISNNKASTTENAKAGSVQTNKAANNTSAANNAQTSNKKTTTATDSSKAAAQLVKDATANTADVANNVAGQAGNKAATDTTTTFNLNTADLGKLSKNVLDNLLRNSFVQTNSTDKVTLNANTLGSSLTNGDATASGNNDTSNYKTVTDWSGLQSVWFFQLKSLKQADSCAKRDRHGCDDACSCVF